MQVGQELADGTLAESAYATEVGRGRLEPGAEAAGRLGHRIGGGEGPAVGAGQRVATVMDHMPHDHRQVDDLIDDRVGVVANQERVAMAAVQRLVIDDLIGRQNHPLMLGMALLSAPAALAGWSRHPAFDPGPVGGRGPRGVGRVLAEASLQRGDPPLEDEHQCQDRLAHLRRGLLPDFRRKWRHDTHITEITVRYRQFQGLPPVNGYLQSYTSRPENAYVKEGMLHIRAIKEDHDRCKYTSARMKTRRDDKNPLFAKAYGRYEFRARLPTGRGHWPALWLLPQEEAYGGWAASGEIDVMEARGQEPDRVLGTLHFGSSWPGNVHKEGSYRLPDRGSIADFHVYALEWEPGEIRWYVDDRLTQAQSSWWSSSKKDGTRGAKPASEKDLNPWPAPFDRPFYLIMNLAVGGKFLGNPDASTPFPAEMVVDYVRVYDKVGGPGPTKPRGPGSLPF